MKTLKQGNHGHTGISELKPNDIRPSLPDDTRTESIIKPKLFESELR